MNNRSQTMTLEQAIAVMDRVGRVESTAEAWRVIKAHLAPSDVSVSDEDVERACEAYDESRNYQGNTAGQAMRSALESMVRVKS